MRAAILLIPFAAAAFAAGAPQSDPYGDNASASMNAVEQAAAEAEAAADMGMAENDMMDMGADANMADTDMTMGNVTETGPPRPAWMADGMWLIAAEELSGAVWYFEAFEIDRTRSPYRVSLRTDETRVAGRRFNNIARTIEVDCTGRRYRILATTRYDDAGNRIQSVESSDLVRPEPPSVWAQVVEAVCRNEENQPDPNGETTFNGM